VEGVVVKKISIVVLFGLMVAPGSMLGAEQSVDIEALKRELRELKQRTQDLEKKLEQIELSGGAGTANIVSNGSTNRSNALPSTAHPEAPAQPSAPAPDEGMVAPGNPAVAEVPEVGAPNAWSPTQPIGIGSSKNFINISLDALMAAGSSTANDIEALEPGGHDPKQRGFTIQNLETTFDGKIDPYLRGQANIVMQITPQGETTLEAEEAYLETMSLPWNLQLKAGQFLTEFGRLNATHPHAWDFVDQPLVNARLLGPEGLRNPGARLSWLAPTPFYSELLFAVQNSQGETAHSFRSDHEDNLFFGRPTTLGEFHNTGDLLFVPRYVASFDLSDSQTIMAGASAAFGPNGTGENTDTQIYGADLFYKWKSPRQHGGYPFVTWQTEAMLRRYEAGAFDGDAALRIPALPNETLRDYGFYSQVAYGFRKGWVGAFRVDYVAPYERSFYETVLGPDPDRTSRWRLSPNLTWYPSEFSKVRLQYNYDHRNQIGDDHSVWMQVEFLLGAHAAHKF
jgi:hypothetical protein